MVTVILAFLMYGLNAAMFVITDDTTYGIWMILFVIILFGKVLTMKEVD